MPNEYGPEIAPSSEYMRVLMEAANRALMRSVNIVAGPRMVDTEVTWQGGFRGRHYVEAPVWDGHEPEDL